MRIKKNIAMSETGFIFDPSTGESYSINTSAQEILQLLKEGKSTEEITSVMTGKYDVDANSFEKYLYDFLGMLRQFQLIEQDEKA